jgi:hypothetical protein
VLEFEPGVHAVLVKLVSMEEKEEIVVEQLGTCFYFTDKLVIDSEVQI